MVAKIRKYALHVFLILASGYSINSRAAVNIYIDFARACNRTTPAVDAIYLPAATEMHAENAKGVCIDNRFVFRNLHVVKLILTYSSEFDSYSLLVYFDSSQLDGLNKFIGTSMNKRYYIIKNNVVMDTKYYSVFTSKLASSVLGMSVDSKQDGIKFGDELSGHKSSATPR